MSVILRIQVQPLHAIMPFVELRVSGLLFWIRMICGCLTNWYACCWPGCLAVMYDAEKIGLIQIRDVKKNNDTAMWLKVVKKSPCYLLKENLARYRRRAVSITPKPLYKRVWAHYPLFHIAEEMNPVCATFWVIMNIFGNAFKKVFYVKKIY